jgi:hypothetical protein
MSEHCKGSGIDNRTEKNPYCDWTRNLAKKPLTSGLSETNYEFPVSRHLSNYKRRVFEQIKSSSQDSMERQGLALFGWLFGWLLAQFLVPGN